MGCEEAKTLHVTVNLVRKELQKTTSKVNKGADSDTSVASLPPPLHPCNQPSTLEFLGDLPVQETSHKWNHTIYEFLGLASFTEHKVLMMHPCVPIFLFIAG